MGKGSEVCQPGAWSPDSAAQGWGLRSGGHWARPWDLEALGSGGLGGSPTLPLWGPQQARQPLGAPVC